MTPSLAGRCARTGMLGAMVTTSSIAVGARCPYAAAGVGAVLTQHTTDPRLGPLGLDLLERGMTPAHVVEALHARSIRAADCLGGRITGMLSGTATFWNVRPA